MKIVKKVEPTEMEKSVENAMRSIETLRGKVSSSPIDENRELEKFKGRLKKDYDTARARVAGLDSLMSQFEKLTRQANQLPWGELKKWRLGNIWVAGSVPDEIKSILDEGNGGPSFSGGLVGTPAKMRKAILEYENISFEQIRDPNMREQIFLGLRRGLDPGGVEHRARHLMVVLTEKLAALAEEPQASNSQTGT